MAESDLKAVLSQRRTKRLVRRGLTFTLGSMGTFLPVAISKKLARKSARWGYLLSQRGDLVIDDYLGEYKMWVNANSIIERQLLTQSYEAEILSLISQRVKAGDHCLDVGSNIGAIALALGRAVGPTGKVYCFEPGPRFVQRLQANLKLNPTIVDRFEVQGIGLSNRSGELFWKEDPEFPGNAWLLGDQGTAIPVSTLDQVVRDQKITRVDLIKIDTEGMELEVLEGAKNTLEEFQPDLILETDMEFEAIRGFPVRQKVETFLNGLGYEFFAVEPQGKLRKVTYPHFTANAFVTTRQRASI